jgi:hypothetical protein
MKIDAPLIARTATELHGLPLKTGQKLAAIVLQANQGTGKALLSLAGGQLTVSTRQPLTAGSAIQLTVRDVGPPLVLGLTPSPTENTAARGAVQTPVQTLVSLLMTRLSASTASSMPKADFGPAQGQQAANTATNQSTNPTMSAESTAGKVGNTSTATPTQSIKLDLPLNVRMALLNLDPVLSTVRTGQTIATPNSMQPGKPDVKQTLARNLTQLITANSLPILPTTASVNHATSNIKSQLKLAAQQLKMQAALASTGKESVVTGRGAQQVSSSPTNARTSSQAAPAATAQGASQGAYQGTSPGASLGISLGISQATSIQSSLEQWISRLDVSQLRTAIQQIQGQATWVVDVPMMVAEQPRRFQIAIQEQAQNTDSATETAWQLDFSIDLPELGPLHGSLSLQSTDLTVRLYADEPQARSKLDGSLDQLAEHLRAASLTPRELNVYPGPPPKAIQERLSPAPIFDEHTTFRCQV